MSDKSEIQPQMKQGGRCICLYYAVSCIPLGKVYLVIGRDTSYFVESHSKYNNKYKQDEIIQMLEFLIDNIFVLFDGQVSQQSMVGYEL